MKDNPYPGLFIDIEGIDGCGGSTQIELLEKWLEGLAIEFVITEEPTNSIIGGAIRSALTYEITFDHKTLQLLFCADRGNHLNRLIIPQLEDGKMVITDRYVWSTIAFGSVDLDMDWLITLNKLFIKPDISIFLNVSAEEAIRRLNQSRLELEYFEKKDFLARVVENYKKIHERFSDTSMIDGEQIKEKVFQDIQAIILENEKFKNLLNR